MMKPLQREQNDIALIEVDTPFDFSDPKQVAPICMADPKMQVIIASILFIFVIKCKYFVFS